MELEQALQKLRNITKTSSSLDAFQHIDLSLAPASERADYELALKTLYKNIYEGVLTKDEAMRKIFDPQ